MTAREIVDTLAARIEETPLKFCASLAFCDATHYVELARTAEACEFHTLVLSDHLVHPETIASRYPYNRSGERPWQAEAPWPDVWVATAAMAAVTSRLRFLQGVYVLPLRDPFSVAKALGTAAVLSNYRVSLGVGLGWMREEFDLLGVEFAERGARADEMIEVLRALFTGESVEHCGRFFDFDALRMRPAVSGPVPIVVGGSSKAALRRVARIGDGWMAHLLSTAELRDTIERLRRYRSEAGRESAPLDVYAPCRDATDLDGYRRLEEIGVTHLLTAPWFAEGGPAAPLAAKKESLARFSDAIITRMEAAPRFPG